MPNLTLKDIIEQSRAGNFRPLYLLHGDETMLTRQAVETLVEAAVDKATADFNYDRFHGGDLNLEKLVTVLNTPPMMAPRRVALVRDLEKMSAQGKDYLASYSARPSAGTVLILAAGERIKVDRKKKSPRWAAVLEENAAAALFWPLKEHELIRWLTWQAERRGKRLESRAAYELYARIGGPLERLGDEVEKLTVFCGERLEITVEDVRGMTGIQTGGTIFDWLDSLASGKTDRTLALADHILTSGESAVGALALAATHYMTLLKIRSMKAARMSAEQIKRGLGLHYRPQEAVSAMFEQAASTGRERIERALALLLEADRALKTSSLPDKLVLERLAFDFHREVHG